MDRKRRHRALNKVEHNKFRRQDIVSQEQAKIVPSGPSLPPPEGYGTVCRLSATTYGERRLISFDLLRSVEGLANRQLNQQHFCPQKTSKYLNIKYVLTPGVQSFGKKNHFFTLLSLQTSWHIGQLARRLFGVFYRTFLARKVQKSYFVMKCEV